MNAGTPESRLFAAFPPPGIIGAGGGGTGGILLGGLIGGGGAGPGGAGGSTWELDKGEINY